MSAGLLQGLGAALSGTAQSMMQMKELERRAKADADRLKNSMDALEISKGRLQLAEKIDADNVAWRQSQADAARMKDALDAESRLVEKTRAREDQLELKKILQGYEQSNIKLRQSVKPPTTGKTGGSQYGGMPTTFVNALSRMAVEQSKYEGENFGKPDVILRNMMQKFNPKSMKYMKYPTGWAVRKQAPVKGKPQPPDITKMSDEELQRLINE